MSTIDEKVNIKIEWNHKSIIQSIEEIKKSFRSIEDIKPVELKIDTKAYSSFIKQILESLQTEAGDSCLTDIAPSQIEQWASDLADETYEALDVAISEALANLSILEGNELVDTKTIDKAKKAIAGLAEGLENCDKKTTDSKKKWDNLNTILSHSSTTFKELGEEIPGLTGEIFTGISDIISISETMSKAIQGVSAAMSALETATGIFAIISAAIKVASFITDIIKANNAANEASIKANEKYADSIEDIKRAATLEDFDTIFRTDSLGIFQTNVAVINKELGDMQSKLQEIQNGGLSSDMRSEWQKFWGSGKDNIHKLSYSDILDENGEFDGEKLRAWYDAYADGLDEEHKKLVEGLLEDWDDYTAAMESMKDYLSGIFSDTASSIADKMIEAFIKTGNAVSDLTDLTQDLAKTLAKNMVQSHLLEKILMPFQKSISEKIVGNDIDGAISIFIEALNAANDWASKYGNDFLNKALGSIASQNEQPEISRISAEKGIAQASQESVDELNGRMTAMQGHTYSLMENTKILVDNSAQMLNRLMNIDFNTARLSAIEKDIHNVSSFVNQVSVQGIKLAV